MAISSLYPFNSILHSHSSQSLYLCHSLFQSYGDSLSSSHSFFQPRTLKRSSSTSTTRIFVISSHSNHKILKSNRRSRYGQTMSPYDSEDDDSVGIGDEEDEDDSEDDWLSDVRSIFFISMLTIGCLCPHFLLLIEIFGLYLQITVV
ncbi:unnamed protein product [Ilex paraguariensis]|uniref:Uncharacterized protein n=1 Tax=Ilex paraguariensis TaxID=185542 RepID=A0ABC8SEG5_9AQUA